MTDLAAARVTAKAFDGVGIGIGNRDRDAWAAPGQAPGHMDAQSSHGTDINNTMAYASSMHLDEISVGIEVAKVASRSGEAAIAATLVAG